MLRAVNSETEWSVLPETLNLGLMVHCCAAISTDVLMHQLSLASYSLHSTRLDTTRAAEVGLLSFLIGAEASTPPRAPTVLQSNCCWPHKKKTCPPLQSLPLTYCVCIHPCLSRTPAEAQCPLLHKCNFLSRVTVSPLPYPATLSSFLYYPSSRPS